MEALLFLAVHTGAVLNHNTVLLQFKAINKYQKLVTKGWHRLLFLFVNYVIRTYLSCIITQINPASLLFRQSSKTKCSYAIKTTVGLLTTLFQAEISQQLMNYWLIFP